MFEADLFWPKATARPLAHGCDDGVDVDSHDNIWLVHRNTPDQFVARTEIGMTTTPLVSACCQQLPVLAFDQDGNLIQSWGGPERKQ